MLITIETIQTHHNRPDIDQVGVETLTGMTAAGELTSDGPVHPTASLVVRDQ